MPLTHGTAAAAAGTVAVTITGVPAGAIVGVYLTQWVSNVRTYTASSSIDGALTAGPYFNPTRAVGFFYKYNATAGDHTITVTPNTGTASVEARPFYITGHDPAGVPITPTGGGFDSGGNFNTHYCAPSGEIDIPAPAIVLCSACLFSASGVSSRTAGSSPAYTNIAEASSILVFWQHREEAVSATDDRGQWTSGGTARQSIGTMIAFPLAVADDPLVYPRITRRRLPGGIL